MFVEYLLNHVPVFADAVRGAVHRAVLVAARLGDIVFDQHVKMMTDRLVVEVQSFGELVRIERALGDGSEYACKRVADLPSPLCVSPRWTLRS